MNPSGAQSRRAEVRRQPDSFLAASQAAVLPVTSGMRQAVLGGAGIAEIPSFAGTTLTTHNSVNFG